MTVELLQAIGQYIVAPICAVLGLRVLEPEGVLVFKWNETQVKLREVLSLTPEKPLFGQVSGRGGLTHWLVFMKGGSQ